MDENLLVLGVAGTAGLGVVLALFGVYILASLMLGTAIVLRVVQAKRSHVSSDDLQAIEDYANRKDGDHA